MDKPENRFLPGRRLQKYRLIEPVSGSTNVWLAFDEKLSRDVVLKVLTRSLPSDKERREAGIRKVRTGAAFHHPAVAAVLDVFDDENDLLMVMERVSGTTLSARVAEHPPEKATIFKWAWQLADCLGAIHLQNLVHGAVNGSTVMITDAGDVKLTGISLKMLIDRRDRGGPELLQTNDLHRLKELSYFAPEQISGKPVDVRADFFSYGVVMYEVVAHRRPFEATSATELASQIVKGQPRQPYEINPRMPPGMVSVIGKCLAKDSFSRYATAKLITAELKKSEPGVETLAKRTAAPGEKSDSAAAATTREAVVLLGDIPYYDLLEKEDPAKASDIAAVMQQIIGEAIYLYDGTVLDQEGSRIIGTMPDASSALRALEKSRNDLAEKNAERSSRGADLVEPRIVVHAGQVTDIPVGGRAIEQAMLLLAAMQPSQLLVSQRPIHDAKLASRSRQIGTLQGIALWEPPAQLEVERLPAAELLSEPVAVAPRDRPKALIATAAAVLVALVAGGAWFGTRDASPAPTATAVEPTVAAPVVVQNRRVHLVPFVTTSTNADDATRLRRIEASILVVLATVPDLDVVSEAAPDVTTLSGRVAAEQPAQLIPTFGSGASSDGPPVPLARPGEAANAILEWIAGQLKIAPELVVASNALAIDHFTDAMSQPAGAAERIASLRSAVVADPAFVPGARLAITELDSSNDGELVFRAAERIAAVDPKNLEIRKTLVALCSKRGELLAAGPHLAALVAGNDRSPETLEMIARIALAGGEQTIFANAEKAIRSKQPTGASIHAPDIVAARGRLDTAVQQYYAVEQTDPANKALALKIGRLAILRRSQSIADSELQKLQELDPDYGFHLLSAYIAAEKRDGAGAERALVMARKNAPAGSDVETSAAEVYAILSQHSKVVQALRRANETGEATSAYILASPLFAYLRDDPSFAKLRAEIEKRRDAMASAVAPIRL